MKKTSLFLSVAWFAMATVSFETHAAGSAATQAPTKSGLGAKLKDLFKTTPKAPAITSTSTAPIDRTTEKEPIPEGVAAEGTGSLAAAPATNNSSFNSSLGVGRGRSNSAPETVGAVVAPLVQAPMAPKAAEAEDAYDLKKSRTSLESTDSQKISEFKSLLKKVGKNRLGSAFSSSKKCRTWGGYRAELVAGRDFYGSNCAIEFCSHYCAPVSDDKFWADKTLGETVCAFRCARGVSMGDSNARLKAAYDATKDRDVWSDALNYWKGLEGASVVTADNLVNANAADAVRSAKAIDAFKATDKQVAKSTSPAIKQAEATYTKVVNAFIAAVVDLLTEAQKATVVLKKKIDALGSTAEAVRETRTSVTTLDETQLESVFKTARDAAVKKVKDSGTQAKIGQLNHSDVETTLGSLTQNVLKPLTDTLSQGEKEVAEVENTEELNSAEISGMETPPLPVSAEKSPAPSAETTDAETTDIEKGLQEIIDGGTTEDARGRARKDFIEKHTDKVDLKKALLAIREKDGDLGKEASIILKKLG